MPPKNPVRAARQAGRQQVRAARVTNRQDERTVRTGKKIANIQARTATKIARINAKPTPKTESKVKAYPAAKAVEKKASAPAPDKTPKKVRPGIKGRLAEAAYNRKAKKTVFDPSKVKSSAKALPASATAPVKLNTVGMRSTMPDVDADNAREAKAAADRKKAIAADKKKQAPAKKKTAPVKKKDDYGYVPDMFLDPKKGETRQNTLPYTFTDKAKADEARKALKDAIGKISFGKKKNADAGRYGPSSKNDYIGIQNFDRMKNNAYGQAPEGPAKKIDYTRKRKGGSIKRKY